MDRCDAARSRCSDAGIRRAIRAQRLPAHRRRQQRDGDRQAPRNGPGRLHRHRHHRRRRTRRRLGPGARRECARRCEALCQSRLRQHPGNRRQFGHGQFLAAAARGGRKGARDAAYCGRQASGMCRRRGTDRLERRRLPRGQQAPGNFRLAGENRGSPAGARPGHAQGSKGLQADRPPGRRASTWRRRATVPRNLRWMS